MKPPQNELDPLGQWTGRVLRQLPIRPAPANLAHQVLAEIRLRAHLPWYQRPWPQWPNSLKWLSALALAVVLTATFGIGIPTIENSASQSLAGHYARLALDYLDSLQAVSTSAWKSLRLSLAHLSTTTFTLAASSLVAVWFSTLGLGALCWRVTTQPR